jgi:hypothetical protein
MKSATKRIVSLSAVATAFFLLILSSGFRYSQNAVAVKWNAMVIPSGNGEADIHFTADVPGGWKMYSQSMTGDGPLPANIEFDPSTSYSTVGAPREKGKTSTMYQTEMGMEVKYLEGKVTYIQHITYKGTDAFSIKCMVNYMLFRDGEILPPDDEDLTISVQP